MKVLELQTKKIMTEKQLIEASILNGKKFLKLAWLSTGYRGRDLTIEEDAEHKILKIQLQLCNAEGSLLALKLESLLDLQMRKL
tara:strand:- start:122 stop:373 length:252 start_codon:yes stop_codon:yes gene_type:complete